MEEAKKSGRPPLTAEQREQKKIADNKRSNEHHKKSGYAAQKKYKEAHPEIYHQNYEPKIRIPLEYKDVLEELLASTELSITQLFVSAVEEKYGVILHRNEK